MELPSFPSIRPPLHAKVRTGLKYKTIDYSHRRRDYFVVMPSRNNNITKSVRNISFIACTTPIEHD